MRILLSVFSLTIAVGSLIFVYRTNLEMGMAKKQLWQCHSEEIKAFEMAADADEYLDICVSVLNKQRESGVKELP